MTADKTPGSGDAAHRDLDAPGKASSAGGADDNGDSGLPSVAKSKARSWIRVSGLVIPTAVVALFLILWLVRREPIPRVISIATGRNGSSYHVFGGRYCDVLNQHVRSRRGRVVETSGSGENVQMLRNRTAQLAMYQAGTVALGDGAIVAPLYREVVHVLVKRRVLEDVKYRVREPNGDLLREVLLEDGGSIYAGAANSGMRHSAREVLDHYGIDAETVHFVDKETQATDVVIATTGMFSKAMADRLRQGDYRYLSLDSEALANRHTHFVMHRIPRASYRDQKGQPVPEQDVSTIATTAFLVVRQDASPRLVNAALDALYQGNLGQEYPDLIPRNEANNYLHGMPVHAAARAFFEPYDIAYLAGLIESVAATKELLVALGASVYLLWTLHRRRQEKLREAEMLANRKRLDHYVDQTIAIESAQIGVTDPARLTEYLADVTRIKLEALDELTDAELRGDRVFSIFLMQCANLISKLQLKMIAYRPESEGPSSPPAEDMGR